MGDMIDRDAVLATLSAWFGDAPIPAPLRKRIAALEFVTQPAPAAMTLTDAELDAALDAIRVEAPEPPPLLHEMDAPMTPEVRALVEAVQDVKDFRYDPNIGIKLDILEERLDALRAGGDA